MTVQKRAAFLASVVSVAGLALAGYWLLVRTAPQSCRICQRAIHAQSRAVIEVDTRREPVCCARCALTLSRQQRRPLRLVEVADYNSGSSLDPATAYFVEGSSVVLCEKHEALFDETKRPHERVFDRCEPSLYAFARREDAEAFAAEKGGVVRRWAEVLQEAEGRP
jgi:hypothetical protein